MRSIASAIPTTFLLFVTFVARAENSLWIPGADPQPISVGVVGVGNDGRTTWEVQQGTTSGTFTASDQFGFFPGKATLVEGPSDAVLSAALTTQGLEIAAAISCTINNGVAVCVNTLSEGSNISTGTQTETVSPMLVQGSGPASGSDASVSTPTNAPATGSPTQSAGNSQASAGSSPTSSGASATGSTGGTNAAGRRQIVGGLLGLGLLMGIMVNCVL